jgi:hypothetical protein
LSEVPPPGSRELKTVYREWCYECGHRLEPVHLVWKGSDLTRPYRCTGCGQVTSQVFRSVEEVSWDTTDPHNPQPLVYPRCSECSEPAVYKRFLSFATGKFTWAWARDCKHKKAPLEMAGELAKVSDEAPGV